MALRPSDPLGRVVGLLMGLVARLRSAKPMHPLGTVHLGRLVRHGGGPGAESTGAAFLDQPGEDEVLARLSRSAGLPAPWPDINGLAIRVPRADGRPADVLMSGAGRGRLTRWTLLPSRSARGGFVSSLVPFQTPSGPVLIGAHAATDGYDLVWARPRGPWRTFAHLALDDLPGRDLALSFDSFLHLPDGLANYGWWERLRGPSYAAARRARGASVL